MKPGVLSLLTSLFERRRPGATVISFRERPSANAMLGWPAVLGLACAFAGLLALAIGLSLQQRIGKLTLESEISARGLRGIPVQTLPSDKQSGSDARWAAAPDLDNYMDDLSSLFQALKDSGLTPGAMEYSVENQAPLPVTVRLLTLHLNEDYPRFKQFAARLLERLPHASLQEVQFDRKDSTVPKSQITVKLALVYRLPDGNRGQRP